jgi:hypothetical protein
MQLDPPELHEKRQDITGPNLESQSQHIVPFVPIQDTLPSMKMKNVPKPQVSIPQRTPSMTNVEGAMKPRTTPEVEVQKEAEISKV